MTAIGTLWVGLMFGVVALIFLADCLSNIARRWATRHDEPMEPTWSAGFSLRRSDSALRQRYSHRKVRPDGRLSGINKHKEDPRDP